MPENYAHNIQSFLGDCDYQSEAQTFEDDGFIYAVIAPVCQMPIVLGIIATNTTCSESTPLPEYYAQCMI